MLADPRGRTATICIDVEQDLSGRTCRAGLVVQDRPLALEAARTTTQRAKDQRGIAIRASPQPAKPETRADQSRRNGLNICGFSKHPARPASLGLTLIRRP
jgi:hypothetical protein